MNEYEVFNKVRDHLLTQMATALSADNQICMYQAPDGKRCAVGCLIKDEFYTQDLEGLSVCAGLVTTALEFSGVPVIKRMIDILEALQLIHDREPVAEWKGRLNDMADKYFCEKDYAEPPETTG